ncbi:MAG: ribosome small subunit-dependent GTPase A [Xanthomonadales bacterium]|nr:ribosome small subunit-dependent GTPase A [Xanthomonadales bacterium]
MQVSYGSHGVVLLADGEQLDCQYRRQVGRPVCGDRVAVSGADTASGAVETIHPRDNHFVRGDRKRRPQVVASNLDQVLVVIAHEPAPSRDLVERYLVAVHSLEIAPVLVVNKVELPAPGAADAHALTRLDAYRELGYPVIETSCKAAPGVAALAPLLDQRTSILVGQSGVGKSSLVRKLLPDLEIQVGRLSRVTGKGTHTTTTTTMYTLPRGGFLMDSPGVWEYGLWKLDDQQLALGFIEFRPHLGACRFNDCAHDSEPACAVKAAVETGEIAQWRYQSYLRLREQNAQGF